MNSSKIKIVVIGDSGVGKTSLMLRYLGENFNMNLRTTIGSDIRTKKVVIDGNNYKVEIWDTAGQEQFRTLISAYFRNADGALLVYDVNKSSTFDNLHKWYEELQCTCENPNIPVIVVGNKVDLVGSKQRDHTNVINYVKKHSMLHLEISVKINDYPNAKQAFDMLVKHIIDTTLISQTQQDEKLESVNGSAGSINIKNTNISADRNVTTTTNIDSKVEGVRCCQ